MAGQNYVRLEFPGLPQNLEFARVACACFASQLGDFTLEELEDIKLVVSEAVSNAIIHGYGGSPGLVSIVAELSGPSLKVTISDEGKGIPDVDLARQPAYTTVPDRLGMGFTIMEALADSLEVTSSPGKGTKVILTKSPAKSLMRREA